MDNGLPPMVVVALQKYNGNGKNGGINKDIRAYCYLRDGYKCVRCGWVKGTPVPGGRRIMTLDHVIPRCEGGTAHPDNLVSLCWPCHQSRNRGLWDYPLWDERLKVYRDYPDHPRIEVAAMHTAE